MVSNISCIMREFRIAVGIIVFGLVLIAGCAGASTQAVNDVSDQSIMYLNNGFSIRVIAVDQEIFPHKLWFAFEKDGLKIDDVISASGDQYLYKKDLDEIRLNIEVFADNKNSIVFLKNIYQSSNGDLLLNNDTSTIIPSEPLSFQTGADHIYSKSSISKNIGIKQIAPMGSYASRTITVDDDAPSDYPSIQQAIDAANSGDTIYIKNGTYFEHLLILKDDLTIIGENKEKTIIDGRGEGGIVVLLGADNNTFQGITILNGTTAIASFPPVEGQTRAFLKEGYSLGLNGIDANALPIQAWITLSKNGIRLDDKIINAGATYEYSNTPGNLIISLKMDSAFSGTSSEYITLNNIMQYSEIDRNIIVQNETALLKTGVPDDFIPFKGGIEWGLYEDYTLSVLDIDAKAYPQQTMLLLSKNGAFVDLKIMTAGENFSYSKNGRLILRADIESIFAGPNVYLAKLSNVNQYSERRSNTLLKNAVHLYIVGSPRPIKWQLFQNYSLIAMEIDSRAFPRQVWLRLSKKDVTIEDKIIQTGNDHTFYKGKSKILNLSVGEIFDGRNGDLAAVSKVYQYSEKNVGRILMKNETHLFKFGSSHGIDWQLYDNYTVSFMGADIRISPALVWMQMKKNGAVVDDKVIAQDQIYSYTYPSNRLIFNGRIDTIFSGNLDFLKIMNATQYSEADGTVLIMNAMQNFYPDDIEYFESLNEKFVLSENYTIVPVDISSRTFPRKFWMRLYRNDSMVDEKILEHGQNYLFQRAGRNIISANLYSIFSGFIYEIVQFKDFYQYSEVDGALLTYLQTKTLGLGIRSSIAGAGIKLEDSNANRLYDLKILNNNYGIILKTSSDNILRANEITKNSHGVYIKEAYIYANGNYADIPSVNNLIYHNNFIDNSLNGFSAYPANRWDNGFIEGGNFWSDYTGIDEDNDGIGDTPYYLSGGRDDFPLMRPRNGTIRLPGIIVVDDDIEDDPANHRWNTIQEGIDDAEDGNVVYVRNGTYRENIAIYRSLTLKGEDNTGTIIDGGDRGNAVYIKANNVKISGFKIINGHGFNLEPVEIRGEIANGSFKWTAENFSGFWYDLDNDLMSEELSVSDFSQYFNTINRNGLRYNTTKQLVQYELNRADPNNKVEHAFDSGGIKQANGGGYYYKIGWQADEYIALNGNASKLAKLVIEQEPFEKKRLSVGETWYFGDGWALTLRSIDKNAIPGHAELVLSKDGLLKDNRIVSQGDVYSYVENSIAGEYDVPLFATFVEGISSGAANDTIQLRYTWAVSTSVTEIKIRDNHGYLKVISVSDSRLELANEDNSITLSRDSTLDIMGKIKIKVADSDILRYYPFVYTKYSPDYPFSYEIRGHIARGHENQTWDARSFSGFYYDLAQDIRPEKLEVSGISERIIQKGDLRYETQSFSKYFSVYKQKGVRVNGLSNYSVTGWQGDQYVAINGNTSRLAKLLLEHGPSSSEKKTLTVGEIWEIGDGWTLTADSIDARASPRQARFFLSKDGVVIENRTIFQGEVFVHSQDIGSEKNVTVFATYLDAVFAGATTDMVQFRYTWLSSLDAIEIKNADVFGKMIVVNASREKLVLKNNYALSLVQGSIVDLMGDLRFRVADSTELRYYPALIRKVASGNSGIEMQYSYGNTISNINIFDSSTGITFSSSSNNLLMDNTVSNSVSGIDLKLSFQNVMKNNDIFSSIYGIRPAEQTASGYDRIYFNNSIDISNRLNGKPIYYYFNMSNISLDGIETDHLTLADCTGFIIQNSSVGGDGINLYYSHGNTLINISEPVSLQFSGIGLFNSSFNEISYGNLNIKLSGSDNNILMENNASISLSNSNRNIIDNNSQVNVNIGISLSNSNDNIISNNKASGNKYGIHIFNYDYLCDLYDCRSFIGTGNNTVINNTASNNQYGIQLYSSKNKLFNNSMNGNKYNFAGNIDNDIDRSNLVDKKPIYILKYAKNKVYGSTTNAGIFYCIDCINITVKDLVLNNNEYGIYLMNTTGSSVRNVSVMKNSNGIYLHNSSQNNLTDNDILKNENGVYIYGSENSLMNNEFSNNTFGIMINSNNRIYHNNFINNTYQAFDYYSSSSWNSSYPSGGNYWSDYVGMDNFKGSSQDQSGSDGIGDTPYSIRGGYTQDRYPFMKQNGWLLPVGSISVISPNGGEAWKGGTTYKICWNYTGTPGSRVKIVLMKNGALNRVINSSAPVGSNGSGSYNWLINVTQTPGKDYRIKVTSTTNLAYNDTSNNNFTITGGISIISPNGGENWTRGTTRNIRWNYTGSPGSHVRIELLKNGTLNRVINSSAPVGSNGSGSYNWLINSTQIPGKDYKVRVTSTTNSAYTDTGNNNFTIR